MITVLQISKSLCGHDPAGTATRLRDCGLQEGLQGFPGAAARISQQPAVMEEEAPEELGDREHQVPMRHGLEHVTAEPLAELHGPFLMARGTKVAALTLEVILHALVMRSQVRLSGAVDRAGFGHGFVHKKTGGEEGSSSEGDSKGKRCARGWRVE